MINKSSVEVIDTSVFNSDYELKLNNYDNYVLDGTSLDLCLWLDYSSTFPNKKRVRSITVEVFDGWDEYMQGRFKPVTYPMFHCERINELLTISLGAHKNLAMLGSTELKRKKNWLLVPLSEKLAWAEKYDLQLFCEQLEDQAIGCKEMTTIDTVEFATWVMVLGYQRDSSVVRAYTLMINKSSPAVVWLLICRVGAEAFSRFVEMFDLYDKLFNTLTQTILIRNAITTMSKKDFNLWINGFKDRFNIEPDDNVIAEIGNKTLGTNRQEYLSAYIKRMIRQRNGMIIALIKYPRLLSKNKVKRVDKYIEKIFHDKDFCCSDSPFTSWTIEELRDITNTPIDSYKDFEWFNTNALMNAVRDGFNIYELLHAKNTEAVCQVLIGTKHKNETSLLSSRPMQFVKIMKKASLLLTNAKGKVKREQLLLLLSDCKKYPELCDFLITSSISQIKDFYYNVRRFIARPDIMCNRKNTAPLDDEIIKVMFYGDFGCDTACMLSDLIQNDLGTPQMTNIWRRFYDIAKKEPLHTQGRMLHDYLAKKSQVISNGVDEAKPFWWAKYLEEHVLSDCTVRFPKDIPALKEVARQYRNCIGGTRYINNARKGDLIFTVQLNNYEANYPHLSINEVSKGVVVHGTKGRVLQVFGFANRRKATARESEIITAINQRVFESNDISLDGI